MRCCNHPENSGSARGPERAVIKTTAGYMCGGRHAPRHRRPGGANTRCKEQDTYLGLRRGILIVTVGSGTKGGTGTVCTRTNTTSLGQVLLALCLADLDGGLLTAATELLRLECVLRLELGAAMLGDVAVSHFSGVGRPAGDEEGSRCAERSPAATKPGVAQLLLTTKRVVGAAGVEGQRVGPFKGAVVKRIDVGRRKARRLVVFWTMKEFGDLQQRK